MASAPANSPDTAFVDPVFSWLEKFLEFHNDRITDDSTLQAAIHAGLRQVSPGRVQKYAAECCYRIPGMPHKLFEGSNET